jgi:hypothetical protein
VAFNVVLRCFGDRIRDDATADHDVLPPSAQQLPSPASGLPPLPEGLSSSLKLWGRRSGTRQLRASAPTVTSPGSISASVYLEHPTTVAVPLIDDAQRLTLTDAIERAAFAARIARRTGCSTGAAERALRELLNRLQADWWLRWRLGAGPVPALRVSDEARLRGLTAAALRGAKQRQAVSRRFGGLGVAGGWRWELRATRAYDSAHWAGAGALRPPAQRRSELRRTPFAPRSPPPAANVYRKGRRDTGGAAR